MDGLPVNVSSDGLGDSQKRTSRSHRSNVEIVEAIDRAEWANEMEWRRKRMKKRDADFLRKGATQD